MDDAVSPDTTADAGRSERARALLEQIRSVWTAGRCAYRDVRLQVGMLAYEYLIARRADGVGEGRNSHGWYRVDLMEELSQALDVSRNRVSKLINVAQAVQLLGEGMDIGRATYGLLESFAKCVERRGERWAVREMPGESAVSVFRRAIGEGWSVLKARAALSYFVPERRQPTNGQRRRAEGTVASTNKPHDVLMASVKTGSPRDVADMIMRLIQVSGDPPLVSKLVSESLATAAGSRRRAT